MTRWLVIGLWRVWDDLPDAPAPTERPPEALLERIAGTFDHEPGRTEAECAVTSAGTDMRHAFEAREAVGRLVLDDARWSAVRKEGGWLPEGVRRHPPGGRNLHALLAYDLAPSEATRFWSVAVTDQAPAEDLVARRRHLGDDMGLPPVGIDSGLLILARQRIITPARRRRVDRDRGAVGD